MNIAQIEIKLQQLIENLSKEEFVFDLLLAYGTPKATVTLLKKGRHNLSKQDGRIILKRKLLFQDINNIDLHEAIDSLQKDSSNKRHNPRFIVVTDYETLLAIDTKTNEHLDIPIKNIVKYYDFFLPWAGIEKHRHTNENPADRKAAEKMAKLYDGILSENKITDASKTHDLNVFLSRLLFCFFAEDTNIFEEKLFTNSIASHTQKDGSDLDAYLDILFDVLNSENRSKYPQYLQKFPYVNGGLFKNKHWIPKFFTKSRKRIIECGELDWSEINPDIFGSMMQAVVHPSERGSLGMHYTSVPNIMKLIEPLFLNDLKEKFEKNKGNRKKLHELLARIARIKFFDPACGSGNFLIIAYKELRRLEMDIIKELGSFSFSDIDLGQFYGIEIDDFAHEIAKLSLYLAEHQMNIEFRQAFGKVNSTLPLKTGGNVVCENATRIKWETVCQRYENDEIYILGNPPYLGFNERNQEQKANMNFAIGKIGNIQRLDYIGCWFIKATDYIQNSNSRYAFVSTNSICQGEQVSLIWPYIISKNQEIYFAFQPFTWTNNAKGSAGVTCVILGVQTKNQENKLLYSENKKKIVKSISPYLIEGNPIIMSQRKTPLSKLPEMILGSSGIDGGHLILTAREKETFINSNSRASKFIKPFIGGGDFINGYDRYCIWIKDNEIEEALSIPLIKDRIDKCREFRLGAGRDARKAANVPHRFFYRKHQEKDAVILPMTSSERRTYLPVGFLANRAIVSNGIFVIYDAEPFIMGIISSKMHMCWVMVVSGKLRSDIRYSSSLCYNTFPIPQLTTKQKEEISRHVYNVLDEREAHPEKTMAEMYDPDKMPIELKEAHHHLDLAIERCYRSKPFSSDEERLEYLFKLYENMIHGKKLKDNKK